MIGTLAIRNRQRVRKVETRALRRLTLELLKNELSSIDFELCLHLVAAPEMARLNSKFLGHEGSTDVITFDHGDGVGRPSRLHGEIFICLDDAVAQARQFRVIWQSELARYVIHGLLHLLGYDDLNPRARRVMKREENRLIRIASRRFPLASLAQRQRRAPANAGTRR